MEPNRQEFVTWLQDKVNRAGGLRRASEKAGVSHATLLRGLQGDPLSLTTLEGIARWTNVSLVRLLQLYGADIAGDSGRVEMALARVLDQYPELESTLSVAIDVLDDDALAEILRFIQFQIDQRRR